MDFENTTSYINLDNKGLGEFMLRWILLILGAINFYSFSVIAQEVPMINDDPIVNQNFNTEMFDFVSKTLGSAKMASHIRCTLKVRNDRELRKFSGGSEWVEVLNISFNSNGFDSGYKMNFKIPMTAKYGIKKSSNQWSGLGEDIKIELGDYYDHWLKFTHDGSGQIIQLIVGNNLRTAPCEQN